MKVFLEQGAEREDELHSAAECLAKLGLGTGPSTGLEEMPGKAALLSKAHGHGRGFSIPPHPGQLSGV